MRPTQIIGVLLIIAGIFVLWKRPTYTDKKDVVEIGDFKASVKERETIPSWIGYVSIGAGVILLIAANRGQNRGAPL
jgi:hypothetical protein